MKNIKFTLFNSTECTVPRAHGNVCFPSQLGPVTCCCGGEVWSPSFRILCLPFFFSWRKPLFVQLLHVLSPLLSPPLTGGCWNFHRWLLVVHHSPPLLLHHWTGTSPSPEKLIQKYRKNPLLLSKKKPLLLCKHDFKFEVFFLCEKKKWFETALVHNIE